MMRRLFIFVFSFIISVILIGAALRFALVDDVLSYTRVMLHEMHHPDRNIDILFVGSSHCYRSVVPEIMDSGFGAYTFNAGSGSQQMDGSLALVREAMAGNRLRQVFVEVYYGIAPTGENAARTQLTGTWILSDYLHPGPNRIRYLLHASGSRYYMAGFIPSRRQWKNLFHPAEVARIVKSKCSSGYLKYEPPLPEIYDDGSEERYLDRGFVANTGVLGRSGGWNEQGCDPIDPDRIHEDHWDALRSILALCQRKGIRVSLFMAPVPDASIAGRSDYEAYKDRVRAEIAGYEAELTDFSLMREEWFDGNDPSLFCDWDHINENGARRFSGVMADYYTGRIDGENLFYGDLEEKLASQPARLYGAFIDRSSEDACRCRVSCNRMGTGTFRVAWKPDDGAEEILLDHGDPGTGEGRFLLPRGEKGDVTITWNTGAEEIVTNLRYNDRD